MKYLMNVVITAMVMISPCVWADDVYIDPAERQADHGPLAQYYTGIGFTGQLLHVNAEMPTRYGNVYVRAGQFLNGDGVAGQIGIRRPYNVTGSDHSGYYYGMFVGHVSRTLIDDERYNRLGAGVEFSYAWINASRLNALSMHVAVGEGKTEQSGHRVHARPKFGVGYTLQVPGWGAKLVK